MKVALQRSIWTFRGVLWPRSCMFCKKRSVGQNAALTHRSDCPRSWR